MDEESVEVTARKLLNQLSELFKTHPRENQWTKECQPMAKVRHHYGSTVTCVLSQITRAEVLMHST